MATEVTNNIPKNGIFDSKLIKYKEISNVEEALDTVFKDIEKNTTDITEIKKKIVKKTIIDDSDVHLEVSGNVVKLELIGCSYEKLNTLVIPQEYKPSNSNITLASIRIENNNYFGLVFWSNGAFVSNYVPIYGSTNTSTPSNATIRTTIEWLI